jgi:hypothetical protein
MRFSITISLRGGGVVANFTSRSAGGGGQDLDRNGIKLLSWSRLH